MNFKAIGISGGSCSGKSTLAAHILQTLGSDQCVILPQDDYFFGYGDALTGKGGPNFDHPSAVDFGKLCLQLALLIKGQAIDRPIYDFRAQLPKAETERVEPRPVILVDGILILHHGPLRRLLDLSIFVECDQDIRLSRRLERDVRERGRTADSVRDVFSRQVAPMHGKYVEPSKEYADIVLESQSVESQFEDIRGAIDALIRST